MYPFLEPLGQALSPGPFKYSCIPALITTYLTFSVHSPHWFSLPTSLVMVLPFWSQVLLFSPVLIPFTVVSPLLTSSLPTLPHIHFSSLSEIPWIYLELTSTLSAMPGTSPQQASLELAVGVRLLSVPWLSPKSPVSSLSTAVLAHAISLMAWPALLLFPSSVQMYRLSSFLLAAWQNSTPLVLHSS